MAITISCEGILRSEEDQLQLRSQIKSVCESEALNLEWDGNNGEILICPQGSIEIKISQDYVVFKSMSSLVGAGYHAYVAEIFQKIVNQGPIYLSIDDECEYLEDHDFERIKETYFMPYLAILLGNMLKMDEEDEACYAWDNKMYLPLAKSYCVITPLGYLPIQRLAKLSIEEASEYFFLWNNLERDAQFYRNSAVHALWNDCYFEKSKLNIHTRRISEMICDALEKSHAMDPKLSQPLAAYLECCSAIGRNAQLTDVEEYALEVIGYRKEAVLYAYGNWLIYQDGMALSKIDGNTMELTTYDEDLAWQATMKITGYRAEGSLNQFAEAFIHRDDAIDEFEWEEEAIKCRGVIYQCHDEENTTMIQAQLISGNETLLMSCEIADLSLQEEMIEKLHLVVYLNEPSKDETDVRI